MHNIGIDIGSSCAKVSIMKDGKIEKNFMIPSGYNSKETAELIKNILLGDGIDIEKSKITATGYGRISVPFADQVMTEITCHGKGADFIFKKNATVIDIGGQDTKVISLKRGRVMKFIMNDKCSAGTGKFMEIMSNRLGLTLEELEGLASNGNDISISSMCTVFAESEVISLIGQGTPREDIANGVINSVVTKVVQLASQIPAENYILTGGFCDNKYFIRKLSEALESIVESCPQARFAGAIGAAIFSSEMEE
ncbi:acyl-CoA dehydratase activase [Peptostreptococcus sp. D1]|uniref:acyl-CoA dehydratase activase n=1 Tax=Peptostreptococcus sp. D1 TaxID=72304 RepID=UPI0008E725EC|nr:acyl-CoA dehydratase activase [Peptostreptococcus sp. D1]SFE82187.1 CoA-substrate-specific enzyme activase, putative [Peptostreptococcus sp. D1]